jgi:stage II sporulation protein D
MHSRDSGALRSAAAALLVLACGPTIAPIPPRPTPTIEPREVETPSLPESPPPELPPAEPSPPGPALALGVSLATEGRVATFTSEGPWEIVTANGSPIGRRLRGGESARVQFGTRGLRLQVGDTDAGTLLGSLVLRSASAGQPLRWNGRRYRGHLLVGRGDTDITVINQIGLEDYLRGVVPLEIGPRGLAEPAAAQAQAIAARSYAYIRIRSRASERFQMVGTVLEQVYGGVEAETALGDSAVSATRGVVLTYGGRVVDAPYHSTCGGSTAAVSEIWHRQRDVPHLQAVSDRMPGMSDRYWCDQSATFRWTRTFGRRDLNAVIARYLRQYTPSAPTNPGGVRSVRAGPRTRSGRLASVTIATDRGRYVVRGNDMRFVFRTPNGRILNSTFVSLSSPGGEGAVTFHGNGNGHGIGMCQWGAIGRARAGHTAQQILAAYYPGTTLARIDRAHLPISE